MAVEMLSTIQEVMMICPKCASGNEMAYSTLMNGFVCLESNCGFELEMEPVLARELLETVEELVCS
jgi:hypothetical protein